MEFRGRDIRSKIGFKIEHSEATYHVVGNSYISRLLPDQGKENKHSNINVNWFWRPGGRMTEAIMKASKIAEECRNSEAQAKHTIVVDCLLNDIRDIVKNPDLLLKYFKEIRAMNSDKVAVVLGESPYPPELRDQGFLNNIRRINKRVANFNKELGFSTPFRPSKIGAKFKINKCRTGYRLQTIGKMWARDGYHLSSKVNRISNNSHIVLQCVAGC